VDELDEPCLRANRAVEQRSPGQRHAELVGQTVEIVRQAFGARHEEQRVRQSAVPLRAPRGGGALAHGAGVGIDANDQCPRVGPRDPHDGIPVAGSQIDNRPLVAGRQLQELADVHLVEAPADHAPHGVDDSATAPPAQTGARPVPSKPSRSK
jgi:hypothetical protein